MTEAPVTLWLMQLISYDLECRSDANLQTTSNRVEAANKLRAEREAFTLHRFLSDSGL